MAHTWFLKAMLIQKEWISPSALAVAAVWAGWMAPTDANKRGLVLGGIIRGCSSKVEAEKASRCH